MQLAMIEYARNVLKIKDATSVEFDEKTKSPIIYLIDNFLDTAGNEKGRKYKSPLGGTMRLGGYECNTKAGTLLRAVYEGKKTLVERHRHRYEANPEYRKQFEKAGMIVSGESNGLIEVVEIKDHPWFLGVQFHPEFTSRLTAPNRALLSFCEAALKYSQDG
jgi:CTP synthase